MTGGKQSLSLLIGNQNTGTCLTTDTVAHEFIHALGNLLIPKIFNLIYFTLSFRI